MPLFPLTSSQKFKLEVTKRELENIESLEKLRERLISCCDLIMRQGNYIIFQKNTISKLSEKNRQFELEIQCLKAMADVFSSNIPKEKIPLWEKFKKLLQRN